VGLVAAIAGLMAAEQINIVSMREHVDTVEELFFARLQVQKNVNGEDLAGKLTAILPPGAQVHVNPLPDKKLVMLVTKEYHCLADILVRNHFNTLGASVQCVIGNHDVLRDVCRRFEVPFHFVPGDGKAKEAFEAEILQQLDKYSFDFIALAKFMRILSPQFVGNFPGKIVNIHHSFLPAFIGANPYRQAFERGVKLIGATAHFVTNDLDEGPIIAQQIIPVTHSFSAADMMRAGKEIETAVLAKALHLLFEDRVFIYKNKTVVFE
jgi:formyltetrahydrofolate deformylase